MPSSILQSLEDGGPPWRRLGRSGSKGQVISTARRLPTDRIVASAPSSRCTSDESPSEDHKFGDIELLYPVLQPILVLGV